MLQILFLVLIIAIIMGLPQWPYWGTTPVYGYYPSGGLGLLLVILLVVWLMRGGGL